MGISSQTWIATSKQYLSLGRKDETEGNLMFWELFKICADIRRRQFDNKNNKTYIFFLKQLYVIKRLLTCPNKSPVSSNFLILIAVFEPIKTSVSTSTFPECVVYVLLHEGLSVSNHQTKKGLLAISDIILLYWKFRTLILANYLVVIVLIHKM